VLVIVWLVDANAFKPRIEAEVRAATGRELVLAGDIELGFFPWLSLETGEGRFGNPAGFPAEPMASWRAARVGVKLFPLLRGDLAIDRVRLDGADVRLVRRADGVANWEGIGSDEPAAPGADERAITIEGVALTDSRLLFVDETVPRRIEITALNFTTDAIVPGKPFTDTELSGVLHGEGFRQGGVPFGLDLPEAAVPGDFSSFDIGEFSLRLADFQARGEIHGELGEAVSIHGRLSSNKFDLRALLAAVGVEAPKTTDSAALGAVQFEVAGRFDDGAVRVDPLALTLDDTHLTGTFTRGKSERAVGEFALHGDRIDIGRYIPPTDPGSEPFVLPVADLEALAFRGVLQFDEARLDDVEMKGVTLRLLLDDQGLRSQPPPAEAAP
jgi:AsmA protein